jgi:tight adherence protein B
MTLIPVLAALSVAGTVVCLLMALVSKSDRQEALERLLGSQGLATAAAAPGLQHATPALRKRSLSSLPFLDTMLARSDWAAGVALDLERAELRLKVGEYVMLRAVFTCLAGLAVWAVTHIALAAVVAAAITFFLAPLYLKQRQKRRIDKLDRQLPEFLVMVSNALKAGFGLMQGLDNAAEQLDAPLSVELRRTLRDIAIGASVEDALTTLNDRVGSKDMDIVITAVLVQRTAGGNLSEILDTTAHTIRERERIKGEIKTLTTQQMFTGYILGVLPVGMAVLLALISREYMQPLFTTTLGHVLIGIGLTMDFIGFLVIRKILAIEV